MPDSLGDRMKGHYEHRARIMLPRRTHTIVRLDGKAFHSYTRGLDKPYDHQLIADMTATMEHLCREVEGCQLGYTQSDEISLILTDFTTPKTQAWFDGNQQKIVSISAAMATAKFNELRPGKTALFDSRAFTIPDLVEVTNYLIWRQQDAVRNSIQMAAQAHFSPAQLHGRNTGELQEMLWTQHGVNWNDYPAPAKRGTTARPIITTAPVTYVDKRTGSECTTDAVRRRTWQVDAEPEFTKHRLWIADLIAADDPASREDTALLAEAQAREARDTGVRHNLGDVIRESGIDPGEIVEPRE